MDDTKYLLPQEIVEEEILTRLPVKSLMRFRCVSKSWRSLIDSDRFAKIQYRNSLMNTSLAHHRVIFSWRFYEMKQCSLRKMLDGQRLHASPFDEDTDISLAFIVGCCNGLFCLHRDGYLLWNPATKLCNKLPEIPPTCSPFVWSKRGFGWDEATGAYKVFALSSEPDGVNSRKRVARVYSSGTRSWTTVDHGSLNIHNEVGLYACGSLHWVAGGHRGSSGSHIECFDLKSEAFGNMEMPPLREHGEVKGWLSVMMLGEVKGWLSVMCDLRGGDAVVWVMKEYGVQESWQKLIHVPRRDNMRARPYIIPRLPGGEMSLLLSCGSNFYVVVCDEEVMNKRKKIKASSSSSSRKRSWCSRVKCWLGACCYGACMPISDHDVHYNTFIYVESLVSPYH